MVRGLAIVLPVLVASLIGCACAAEPSTECGRPLDELSKDAAISANGLDVARIDSDKPHHVVIFHQGSEVDRIAASQQGLGGLDSINLLPSGELAVIGPSISYIYQLSKSPDGGFRFGDRMRVPIRTNYKCPIGTTWLCPITPAAYSKALDAVVVWGRTRPWRSGTVAYKGSTEVFDVTLPHGENLFYRYDDTNGRANFITRSGKRFIFDKGEFRFCRLK